MRILAGLMAILAAPLAAQDAPALYDATRAAPVVAGQWRYAVTATGSEATLPMRFLIRCDRNARRVTLRRIEPTTLLSAPAAMTITTDLGTRTIASDGIVANSDRVLDAIAFSRGRFIVTGAAGSPRLVIPTSPEAARSIEDCRI